MSDNFKSITSVPVAPVVPIASIASSPIPILAIISQSLRMDNHGPLKYFKEFEVKHFYFDAPYGDLKIEELKNVVQWHNFKDLEKKLMALNPDLIQGAEPYASRMALRISLLTQKVAKKLNKPYIFPMLENRSPSARFGLLAPALKYVLKKYALNAALIYYLNEGAKRNLLEVGADPKKLKKELYGIWGIDTSVFKPVLPLASSVKRRYILFVGRLIEDKGIAYLLAAWNCIKLKYPDIDLVFVGQGEMEKDISGAQIQKLGLVKNVDLPPYFANALFTVYPSVTTQRWEEQVGTVNLQSLSCGTPVLTTTSGAIPEYVTENVGILVPERDAGALSKAMEKLIQDSDSREKLAQNARPYILENFDAEKIVQKIEAELLKMIKGKNE